MLFVMLLLFGAVLFIIGTDIERLRNYKLENHYQNEFYYEYNRFL